MMKNIPMYATWDEEASRLTEGRLSDDVDVLKWAYDTYRDDIVYSCSFGAEGIVLIDLISQINPNAEVVFLDTGLHFKETYELIKKVRRKYPDLHIRMLKPELTVEEQATIYGDQLWQRNPNSCCHMRKIVPLSSVLKGRKAWISGLRKEQSTTRSAIRFLNKDEKFQSVKICPLKDWTWDDVWAYIKLNDLPYNPLHDQGYPSIGCDKCTLPVKHSDDLRSGRWAQLKKTECGLHQ
jgi:phosphoadenosine phosphosulfate reductase